MVKRTIHAIVLLIFANSFTFGALRAAGTLPKQRSPSRRSNAVLTGRTGRLK